MDFYLDFLKDTEHAPDDRPSIGIILCAEKDDVEVKYALKTKKNPVGVAEYEMQAKLPAKFKGSLPHGETTDCGFEEGVAVMLPHAVIPFSIGALPKDPAASASWRNPSKLCNPRNQSNGTLPL